MLLRYLGHLDCFEFFQIIDNLYINNYLNKKTIHHRLNFWTYKSKSHLSLQIFQPSTRKHIWTQTNMSKSQMLNREY
jgi:spore coat protein U-like protein